MRLSAGSRPSCHASLSVPRDSELGREVGYPGYRHRIPNRARHRLGVRADAAKD